MASFRVLIADDNADAGESLGVLLSMADYEIQVVLDGWQAVNMAQRFMPDAVVLDVLMPLMNGLEAARVLRRTLGDHLVIVGLSGHRELEDVAAARAAGFDAYFAKPGSFPQLRARLEELLEERSHAAQSMEHLREAA